MMDLLKDPDMHEVVIEFCNETDELSDKLEELLEQYEDNLSQTQHLEEFGQVIDRVMGAAKSLGAQNIGTYCELGKIVSYKSSQTKDVKMLEIVAAVLFDTVDILKSMVKNVRSSKEEIVQGISLDAFATRLKWLSEKFDHIERSSVALDDKKSTSNGPMDQKSINDLLEGLGL
ncbi:MAG: hypothetical protein N4A33_11940 [Bacteriovoracaceae bacterium]|nr:hypothetical protein [Bacteriovoracaceae bacterium]